MTLTLKRHILEFEIRNATNCKISMKTLKQKPLGKLTLTVWLWTVHTNVSFIYRIEINVYLI